MTSISIHVESEDATERLGQRIGESLTAGSVVGLDGPLGAGKTRLIRGIALGCLVEDLTLVTSPTFVIQQDYYGRLPVHHFDVYRLGSPAELIDLGALELFEEEGICLIEWADRVEDLLPERALRIRLEIVGEFERRTTLSSTSPDHLDLLRALQSAFFQPES